MHRVARRDLEALVFVAIATAPPLIKRKLKSRLPHEADEQPQGRHAPSMSERLLGRRWPNPSAKSSRTAGMLGRMPERLLDNDSYMVIVTELIARTTPYPRLGQWGVDEPVPTTVPRAPSATQTGE